MHVSRKAASSKLETWNLGKCTSSSATLGLFALGRPCGSIPTPLTIPANASRTNLLLDHRLKGTFTLLSIYEHDMFFRVSWEYELPFEAGTSRRCMNHGSINCHLEEEILVNCGQKN